MINARKRSWAENLESQKQKSQKKRNRKMRKTIDKTIDALSFRIVNFSNFCFSMIYIEAVLLITVVTACCYDK